jgi:1-aminocyclopropane-1-carboxylate deaminase/D-cysteine desulfhydrase-like pyridoxal-dependent ACC family enzyme
VATIPTYESLKIYELTPVEQYDDDGNGIIYKRDDKYMPFSDVPLNGGKVRQCACLFLKNYNHIKNECNSLVATATSVNSPQGINVSRVAKEFGFSSLIVFGATKAETLMKNPLVQWMQEFGSTFDYKCKIGYDIALVKRINDIKATNKLFHVKFGINLESDPDSIINSIAYQVQNLPKDIDNLIIPTGSAITAGGILVGLKKYDYIKPKRVIVVQISGYDRQHTLRRIFDRSNINYNDNDNNDNNNNNSYPKYEYVADTTYPYSKHLNVRINNNTENLDPVYEAKGYNWMIKNIDYKHEKTLFWVVGDSSYFRTLTPEIQRTLYS